MSQIDINRSDGDPQRIQGSRGQSAYKFSAEELRVIKECNRESFFQRCLPIGTGLGIATYYGVQSGFLRPSNRFGAVPKVAVAVVIGYFVGKFSYQGKCAQKLMQLPNSQLGDMLRKRKQGNFQESLEPGFGPGMSLAPFSGISSSDTYTDLQPNSTLDMDTSRPQNDGLDDSHRPSVDNPIYEEDMPPVQKHVTTYDELRKQNREEYQQKRLGHFRGQSPSPGPSRTSQQTPSVPDEHKNKYGDVFE